MSKYSIGEFKSTADYQYQLLRCNVDLLKIIQLGLTFLDEKGKLPESGPSTWQFNFKFNLTEDMYAEDSVDLVIFIHTLRELMNWIYLFEQT